MTTENEEILKQLKALSAKVEELTEGDDLERELEMDEEKKRSQMLDLDPERTDSFGDSIELVTKSRLRDYSESYNIAKSFVLREYHNMVGNRYGRHSKLIPVFNDDGSENKIDLAWFSGNDIKIVEIAGKEYYKVRLLVYDILTKKILISRIPSSDGAARQEEIQHIGAEKAGRQWTDINTPINPMKPLNYSPQKGQKTTMKNVGEMVFE